MDYSADDSAMMDYRNRLATFRNWPYTEEQNCTPDKMAEAGFYLFKEPDEVRCYYCRRELDGWEPDDIPWKEHERRDCPYIKKKKLPKDLTVEDVYDLEAERYCCILAKMNEIERDLLTRRAEQVKEKIGMLGCQKQTRGRPRKKRN